MNISEKMAVKLRMLREVNNYTQEYVANVLDVSPNTVSLLEKGLAALTIDRIEKLAALYKMEITDLLRLSEQTIIHHITHSNGICSENVNIHTGAIEEEERKFMKDTIARLDEQNKKLMDLLEKLSAKFM